jgi:hypothetical protein
MRLEKVDGRQTTVVFPLKLTCTLVILNYCLLSTCRRTDLQTAIFRYYIVITFCVH